MAHVTLKDIAREYKSTIKDNSGLRIVGLEHLDSGDIELHRWNEGHECTFSKAFKKGQILFGRRRAYLKKAVIAPFEGVCSGDIIVIEAIPNKVNPLLLPFIIQNDKFFDYAMSKSAGSLSPRVKWADLKEYSLNLPSEEEQQSLVELLIGIEETKKSYRKLIRATDKMVNAEFYNMLGEPDNNHRGYPSKYLYEIADEFFAGGDKPKDISEREDDVYCYPVYANGIENEGLLCYSKECRVSKPAVTVSARGTIGYAFCRMKPFTPVVRLITIVPNSTVNLTFLKYSLDNIDIERTGSSQPQLTVPALKNKRIIVPPIEVQDKFARIVEQSNKIIVELSNAINILDNFMGTIV